MSSVQGYDKCEKCGYPYAIYETSSHGYEWFQCGRCGYSVSSDYEQGQTEDNKCLGASYTRIKGSYVSVGPIFNKEEFFESIKKEKNNCDQIIFTEFKNNKWWIIDYLKNKRIEFKDEYENPEHAISKTIGSLKEFLNEKI